MFKESLFGETGQNLWASGRSLLVHITHSAFEPDYLRLPERLFRCAVSRLLCHYLGRKGFSEMKFPFPKFSLRRPGKLSRRDARVFAEASELALLRLEQCIADRYISVPGIPEKLDLSWTSPSPSKKIHEPGLSQGSAEVVHIQRQDWR
jgi:hypothetical protein